MKKTFKRYAAVWAVALIVFNVICFVTPNELAGFTKLDKTFWTAYAFITAAFVGQLLCAYRAFKAENAQKLFYSLPLVTVSYTGLVVMLVCGAAVMMIPNLPAWVGAVVCLLVLAFTAMAVIKADTARELVEAVDDRIKTQTSFIKNLTVEAEGLMARAKSPEAKAACKKVYEAVRYSDPMSNEALSVIEAKITVKFNEFVSAVGSDDAEKAKEIADELVILVGDRNKKCKVLK